MKKNYLEQLIEHVIQEVLNEQDLREDWTMPAKRLRRIRSVLKRLV